MANEATGGNDSWSIPWPYRSPFVFSLDALGGTDTLYFGAGLRSNFVITRDAEGRVHVDSQPGAAAEFHAILINLETLVFNDKRDVVNLAAFFASDTSPPTLSITDDLPGVATSHVTYSLSFSESVFGLTASDFSVSNGKVVAVSGGGASYTVVVAPLAGTQGSMGLTLKASAVTDAAGHGNAQTAAAPQPIDTLAPSVISVIPANQATDVQVTASIVLTFSEPVLRGAGSITLKDAAGTTVASYDAATSGKLSLSGNTVTISPGTDLAVGTSYSVSMSAGSVRDTAGNGAAAGSTAFSTAAHVVVTGTSGADTFTASGSVPMVFDGLSGIDTLILGVAATTITRTATGYRVTNGSVVDTLVNVERLQFSDGHKLALDIDGHAGQAAKVLGAVFGADAVKNAEYVGIGLGLLDANMSYADLVQLALHARLGQNASHAEVVHLLYSNVMGDNAPSAASDKAYFINLLDNKVLSVVDLGVLAADTAANQAQVDLVGLAASGLSYS